VETRNKRVSQIEFDPKGEDFGQPNDGGAVTFRFEVGFQITGDGIGTVQRKVCFEVPILGFEEKKDGSIDLEQNRQARWVF